MQQRMPTRSIAWTISAARALGYVEVVPVAEVRVRVDDLEGGHGFAFEDLVRPSAAYWSLPALRGRTLKPSFSRSGTQPRVQATTPVPLERASPKQARRRVGSASAAAKIVHTDQPERGLPDFLVGLDLLPFWTRGPIRDNACGVPASSIWPILAAEPQPEASSTAFPTTSPPPDQPLYGVGGLAALLRSQEREERRRVPELHTSVPSRPSTASSAFSSGKPGNAGSGEEIRRKRSRAGLISPLARSSACLSSSVILGSIGTIMATDDHDQSPQPAPRPLRSQGNLRGLP